MKIVVTLLLLCSTLVLAGDYKIVRFEASDYRTFTLSELLSLIGENHWVLPHHSCNGRDENDPFTGPVRKNIFKNSLKINVPKSDQFYFYQERRLFTPKGVEVSNPADPFVERVFKALRRLESSKSIKTLFRYLEASYFPLEISLSTYNSFNPRPPGARSRFGIQMAQAIAFLNYKRMSAAIPFNDVGVGGQIYWNPMGDFKIVEEDGVLRNVDPDVALGHELYHAFDSIRGVLDMGMVKGAEYPFESVLEYRAVYFENVVRQELGHKKRKFYSIPTLSPGEDYSMYPDMLDEDGEPISIPAPCLDPDFQT